MSLSVARGGKEPIVVWRRGRWQSMPHLLADDGRPIGTRCGAVVELGYGIDSIVQTQVTSQMFLAIGCGVCRMALLRDLRDDLLLKDPTVKARFKDLLGRLEWQGS